MIAFMDAMLAVRTFAPRFSELNTTVVNVLATTLLAFTVSRDATFAPRFSELNTTVVKVFETTLLATTLSLDVTLPVSVLAFKVSALRSPE